MNVNDKPLHRVLWTGGWDSTFRVLNLLSSTDHVIQPYYLIYLGRASSLIELRTINQMMDEIEKHESWKGRLLAPIIRLADRYKYANEPYAQALEKVRQTWWLGSQYLCLAQFRDQEKLVDLELGLQSSIFDALRGYVPERDSGLPRRLSKEAPWEFQVLFGGYLFPILWTSKLEMKGVAEQKGFIDVLNMSWFCHQPVDGKPCGHCNPCRHVIDEGMEYRIGPEGMARYRQALESSND